MPLQKQAVTINFQMGMDQKSDPFQIPFGRFTSISNAVFDKVGRLTKRNGFGSLPALPDQSSSYVTTFNQNLTAIGSDLKALAQGVGQWYSKATICPLQLETLSLVRNSTNQIQADAAVSPSGLVCTVYTDSVTLASSTQSIHKYVVADVVTGQNIIPPTEIISQQGQVIFSPRVFSLGNNFIVAFSVSSGSTNRLQYFSIGSRSPGMIGSVTDISTNYQASAAGAFDGFVANNALYFSWNGATNSGIKASYLLSTLTQSNTATIASATASIISVTGDITASTPVIWTSAYVAGSQSGVIVATDQNLTTLFSARQFVSSATPTITNIATTAQGGILNLLYEVTNAYTYSPSVATNFINKRTALQSNGSLSAETTLVRSVGLASKGFLVGSASYVLSSYQSPFQSTYFLLNSSGGVGAKLAYGNGFGYYVGGLPSVSVYGNEASLAYILRDSIEAVNKDTNVPSGTQVNGIYSQFGASLVSINFGTDGFSSNEAGKNLNFNGGFLWGYDGFQAVENNFHLYPDNIVSSANVTGGSLSAQQYYYQVTYEWSDNQGNIFRSAPSIPVTSTVSTGSAGQMIIRVPTIRLTYKTQNPAKIVIYRWSASQQVYYQVTSITTPVLNSTSMDFVSYTDGASDAAILGNNIIYTNGGVIENTGGPSFTGTTIFDSRFWGIDAEDQNKLWYSKEILEETPVEMSDLFTLFVSPNSAAQGPTGPIRCIAPMDDKLIIFKKNAIYFVNGRGPDNTGANNQYSEPIFITGTVGCDNQASIVLTPNGLMFQSDKGIWLLARDLSTNYIGKDVENYNEDPVLSAVAVPATNQVRFTMTSNTTLMYDYFTGQWGTFAGIKGIASTLYNNLHTYINAQGRVFQETPGAYLDGSNPVLMSFRTGWQNLAGLQGYQRLYQIYVLGEYQSPHRYSVGLAFDYDSSISQQVNVTPTNFNGTWGSAATWGAGSPWGGKSKREQWQINVRQQTCQSFQITFNEYFDASMGVLSAQGLTISGLDLVTGLKAGFPKNIGVANKKG